MPIGNDAFVFPVIGISLVLLKIITVLWNYSFQTWNIENHEGSIVLAIGILSARDNFIQRNAARSTWMRDDFLSENVKPWFIVGSESCKIPPQYRVDNQSCQKWNVNYSSLQEIFFTTLEENINNCSKSTRFYQGFTFQVHHPVVVTQLGIISSLISPNSIAKVAILDIQSKEVVIEAHIFPNASVQYGFIYHDVEAIYLPKNYEGLVFVEGFLKSESCSRTILNNGGGIISFKRMYYSADHLDSEAFHADEPVLLAPSVKFYVPEIDELKKKINKKHVETDQWLLHLEEINTRLMQEKDMQKDILLVDVLDVYRNLPVKLLKFYQWLNANYNFQFVMKTDDDSLINVPAILNRLQTDSRFHPMLLWLWSNFRKNWPVNYVGKWEDFEYRCPYYPTFPCGSAYIMSRSVVNWLTENEAVLHSYQGEDVSMGIWLSAINPIFYEDENFECSVGCRRSSYNRAQLGPTELETHWETFKRCDNFCACEETTVV